MSFKYPYFVLGYSGIDYFDKWFNKDVFPNTKLRIVDNGQQVIPKHIELDVIYTTSRNIGCSGGWNLICEIGFNHYGLEKIIVGQEDARVTEEIFKALMEGCNEETIYGTYNNSFEFSTYCIHRDTYQKIGKFDENFVYASCEDNDYKHRASLVGVSVVSLNVPHHYNASLANNNLVLPSKCSIHNREYIEKKWNNYTFKIPFNGETVPKFTEYFIEIYGDQDALNSELEFERFKDKFN